MVRCTQRQGVIILLAGLFSCLPLYAIPQAVDASASIPSPSFLMQSTLLQYAAQKDLYAEGEGESTDESIFLPWEQYASMGGIIGLALGIVWLAEEPPSPCMVATAAYGTPLSPRITILRRFRDQILLNTIWGTAFVDFYYHVGWRLAKFVGDHDWAAWMLRIVLVPVLFMAAVALTFPQTAIALGYVFLATAMLLVLYWVLRTLGLCKQDVQVDGDDRKTLRS